MSRIKLEMGGPEMLFALTEGNPGAVRVVMEMMRHNPQIDPRMHLDPLAV